MTNPFTDSAMDYIWSVISSGGYGNISIGITGISILVNMYQYKSIKELNQAKEDYRYLLMLLEPIITKILDNKPLTITDKQDLSKIREKILFELKK